jgi:aquaporin PIP
MGDYKMYFRIVCSNGSDGKIALAFFGSLALCAPISGGHINPAVNASKYLGHFSNVAD